MAWRSNREASPQEGREAPGRGCYCEFAEEPPRAARVVEAGSPESGHLRPTSGSCRSPWSPRPPRTPSKENQKRPHRGPRIQGAPDFLRSALAAGGLGEEANRKPHPLGPPRRGLPCLREGIPPLAKCCRKDFENWRQAPGLWERPRSPTGVAQMDHFPTGRTIPGGIHSPMKVSHTSSAPALGKSSASCNNPC